MRINIKWRLGMIYENRSYQVMHKLCAHNLLYIDWHGSMHGMIIWHDEGNAYCIMRYTKTKQKRHTSSKDISIIHHSRFTNIHYSNMMWLINRIFDMTQWHDNIGCMMTLLMTKKSIYLFYFIYLSYGS